MNEYNYCKNCENNRHIFPKRGFATCKECMYLPTSERKNGFVLADGHEPPPTENQSKPRTKFEQWRDKTITPEWMLDSEMVDCIFGCPAKEYHDRQTQNGRFMFPNVENMEPSERMAAVKKVCEAAYLEWANLLADTGELDIKLQIVCEHCGAEITVNFPHEIYSTMDITDEQKIKQLNFICSKCDKTIFIYPNHIDIYNRIDFDKISGV